MNFKKYIPLIVAAVLGLSSCEDFLDKKPLGIETDQNFYNDPTNATMAANSLYDVIAWTEGSRTGGWSHDFVFYNVLSDDALKGSTAGDYVEIQNIKEWTTLASAGFPYAYWYKGFTGVFRANTIIKNLPAAGIDTDLKNRILGEAYCARAFFYFDLVAKFGPVPLMTEPLPFDQWGSIQRAAMSEIYKQIESDLDMAITMLPAKSLMNADPANVGRFTKGAAQAYKARILMFEIGTDNTLAHTWQQVYDLSSQIIASGEYALVDNYATIWEAEGENNSESIFEIQYEEDNTGWGEISSGTTNSIVMGNRSKDFWGWGFNNGTQALWDAFEDGDPRRECTLVADGNIIYGVSQVVDPAQHMGTLNRKFQIDPALRPSPETNSAHNDRRMRYADVILMKAEAAAHLNKDAEAQTLVNQIRARALKSTHTKGSSEGKNEYVKYAAADLQGKLPNITATGAALLDAILHERRVEFGMEGIRYLDLVRTGKYLGSLSTTVKTSCQSHCITEGLVNPMPVLPIPLNEAQSWNLAQNPNY